MPSIHTSLSGMPFHSFSLKFHGKNAAMGRCDGPRTYLRARWKAIIMAETMVCISLLKGEYIHHPTTTRLQITCHEAMRTFHAQNPHIRIPFRSSQIRRDARL